MTKHILKPLVFLIVLVCGTGCTTSYWVDRGRDAADIFTVAAGYGVGVQGRVGYLIPGIGYHGSLIGLEDGEFFAGDEVESEYVSIFIFGLHTSSKGGNLGERHKRYTAITICGLSMVEEVGFPFATQLEVTVGLGPSVRLGFNPGELLDFLLGWFYLDPADDDLERRKEQKIEQTGRPSGPP